MLGVVQFAAQCTKELKTGQVLVRFDLRFLTGQIAKKPDCPVKNRTPGNIINQCVYHTNQSINQSVNRSISQ